MFGGNLAGRGILVSRYALDMMWSMIYILMLAMGLSWMLMADHQLSSLVT